MKIITAEQQTEDWHAARLGCLTASNAYRIVSKPRSESDKFSKTQWSYIHDLVAETLTGGLVNSDSQAMAWGRKHEEEALNAYEEKTGKPAYRIGFAVMDKHDKIGCSVDAISDDCVIEVKCPYNPGNHVDHLINGPKREYMLQMQMQMWVTGKKTADFVSYDPRFPPDLRCSVMEISRNRDTITLLEEYCPLILEQVDIILDDLL